MSMLTKFTKLTTNLGSIMVKNPTGLRHVIGTALATSEDVLDPELDLRSLPAVGVWELTQALPTHGASCTCSRACRRRSCLSRRWHSPP